MRMVEISERELHKVMQDRLAEALFANDSKTGVILLTGEKPGITYAHTRMSAKEHVSAAKLLLGHARRILEEKEIGVDHDGARVLLEKSTSMVVEALKQFPSEMKKDMPKDKA